MQGQPASPYPQRSQKPRSSRFATILRLCSLLVTLYSFSMLAPIAVGLYYQEGDVSSFVLTFVAAASTGVIGYYLSQSNNNSNSLKTRDGFLVAVLFWLSFSLISAMPFVFDTRLNIGLTDALFEGVSGITTTGATVFPDVDVLPRSILFYRSQLNFLGGLGIIVLAVAVLPMLGVGGSKLYRSEMPGPIKEEKLTPRLADTAQQLWVIYLGLGIICALFYFAAGMTLFDAICHSLSTVSLGGFSTHTAGVGFYDSVAIEIVGGVFTVLAAVNFALYFTAITHRSLRPLLHDQEFRFFILVLLAVVSVTCIELYRTDTFGAQESAVHGFFMAASIMTDNGLVVGNYPSWPSHIVLLLLGASFFGGCVGSTCGGIKAMRFLVLYLQSRKEVHQLVHPARVHSLMIGRGHVSDRMVQSVWSLFFFYIFATCVFVWGLMADGYDLETAFGTVAACINNMGVGYGDTAVSFDVLSMESKLWMCAAMLLGRLEIFPFLILFSKSFWRY